MRRFSLLGIVLSGVLLGCQPPPRATVPDVPEPPMVQARPVCEPGPPEVVEVPVPVPMPGQLQPVPDLTEEAARPQKGQPVGRLSKGTVFNSVTEYPYMEGALYQVYVAVGKHTTIRLAPDETFHQAPIGDDAVWSAEEMEFGEGENARGGLWVSCNESGKHSTLSIAGTKHLYLLEVHCTTHTHHALIHWSYPKPRSVKVLKGSRPIPVQPAPVPVVVPDAPSEARYTWEANREIAWSPTHVYDTGALGQQTVIVFPRTLGITDAPALYVRSPEGTQALVNFRVRQGHWIGDRIYPVDVVAEKLGVVQAPQTYYLVDRIAEQLELRVGEKFPTVVTIRRQR